MTKTLEKAFTEAARLPAREQDAWGRWLLAELAAETRWDSSLRGSSGTLARLADKALKAHRAGRTRPLVPEQL